GGGGGGGTGEHTRAAGGRPPPAPGGPPPATLHSRCTPSATPPTRGSYARSSGRAPARSRPPPLPGGRPHPVQPAEPQAIPLAWLRPPRNDLRWSPPSLGCTNPSAPFGSYTCTQP